jgi:hypothetical protein
MGARIRDSDGSTPLKGELPKTDPSRNDSRSRNDFLRNPSQRTSVAPVDTPPETIEPPRRSRTPRGVFEGDAAAVELRSRLARARDETLLPAVRRSAPRRQGTTLRYMGFLVVAAASAGAGGYLLATLPSVVPLPVNMSPVDAPAGNARADFGEADVAAPLLTPAVAPELANRDSRMPAPRTAAVDLAPVDVRRAPGDAVAPLPAPPAQDPSEVAAKLKLGADLMASGDIAAARTMFERVAEAGEAAGAFALAETFDPAVLRTLRLRGGIKADPALAQRWYEKARDLGSRAATDRIIRLTQNPGR